MESLVGTAQREQFAREGYCVIEGAIPPDDLTMLRDECAAAITEIEDQMDRDGTDVYAISVRGKRYFVPNRSANVPGMLRFVAGPRIAEICGALLGDDAYLLHEQFVVKMAEVGLRFEWHQDSGYVKNEFAPYDLTPFLTCWCALDDMTVENGTIWVLPFTRAPGRDLQEFTTLEATNDLVAYTGDDPGEPLVVPAGTVVAFSSYLLHRSGANATDQPRRGFTCHYTTTPMLTPEGAAANRDIPVLQGGRYVGPLANA
jgi:ectoine hydroxylase-related dioxygenase (phytanoyl-CoA dioxygenase family)